MVRESRVSLNECSLSKEKTQESKIFLVNKLSLEESLDERILELDKDKLGMACPIEIKAKIEELEHLKASLMHVSEEEKCVEISPSLEAKLRNEVVKEVKSWYVTSQQPKVIIIMNEAINLLFQKLRESVK